MRTVKFRGKRIDNGEWIYGNLIGTDVIVGDIVEFNDEYFNTEFWYKVDSETVGQFTGLTDQNGKEIYEGDIFRAPHDFGPGGFDIRDSAVRYHKIRGYQWEYWLLEQLEVIGTIYGHPEPLEVK